MGECGTDCIINVRVMDIDAKSNLVLDHAKVLVSHVKRERKEIP
jgi:hypothetical protein